MFNLTRTFVINAPAGIPLTAMVLLIPASATAAGEAGGPITSGIWIFKGVTTAGKTDVAGDPVFVIEIACGVPRHMLGATGFIVATNGPTVNVAAVVGSGAVQGPDITARYW